MKDKLVLTATIVLMFPFDLLANIMSKIDRIKSLTRGEKIRIYKEMLGILTISLVAYPFAKVCLTVIAKTIHVLGGV